MPGLDLNHANPGQIKVQNITAASKGSISSEMEI